MNKTQQDYYDNIINMIELQQSLLTEGITNFKQNKHEIDLLLENKETIIFSRLDDQVIVTCNYCKKKAVYHDMNNKYYCWFHRSQLEQ
jgi:hypothetical protein